jgi:sarcosine oxidase delta subunit
VPKLRDIKDCLTKYRVDADTQKFIISNRDKLMAEGMSELDANVKSVTDFQQETLQSVQDIFAQLQNSEGKKVESGEVPPVTTGEGGTGEGTPPSEPTKPQTVTVGGGETIGITHADMDAVANELGLATYTKDPQTEEQWIAEADQRLRNGEMIPLIRKMEADIHYQPDGVENTMAKRYIASLKARINANPTRELLAELDRAKEAFNMAGRAWGISGRSRQGMNNVEDTLADYLLDRGNDKGHPLTDEQIKEESDRYNELKKEKDELQDQLNKEKEAHAKLIAEVGINKAKAAAKKASKKSHEEYVAERKELKKSIQEKWRNAGKDVLSSDIPFRKQFAAIAPDVKKLMQTLIDEGIDNIDKILTDVHAELKDIIDGIRRSDIVDMYVGVHDDPMQTKSGINETLRLLNRELDYVTKLDKNKKLLEKTDPKQKARIDELSRIIKDLETKIEETRKLYKTREVPNRLEANKKEQERLQKRIDKLNEDLRTGNYDPEVKDRPKLKKSYSTLLKEDKVISLEKKIAHERYKDQQAKRSKSQKWYDFITKEVLGIRRLVQTILDISIWLRQTVRIAFNPRKWDIFATEVAKSWASIWSQTKFDRYMNEIHKDPDFDNMTKDGIRFNEFETNEVAKENEFYYKNWLFKIPVLKELPLASQRGADAALNVARYELYKKYARNLKDKGITRESDPKVYEWMSNEVMNQTGSGKLLSWFEGNQKAQRALGNTFYGARLMAANFNQLNPAYYAKMPQEVRALIWKDIAAYVGTTMFIGVIGMLAGASVSFDPEDPEFLQLRFGDKVYDITGGKAQYIRTALRILRAATTSMNTDKTKYEKKKAWEFASKSTLGFFRNKLAPNTGYVATWTFGQGKNSIGQDANPWEIAQLYPMYFDDVYKAFQEDGMISLATTLVPNLIGVGYNSYYSDAAMKPLDDLLQRNMTTDEQDKSKIKNFKDKGREITNKEFKEYADKRDSVIEKMLTTLYKGGMWVEEEVNGKIKEVRKPFVELSNEEIIKETNYIKSKATREVKEAMFGKEKETAQERRVERKISKLKEAQYK